MEQPLQHAQQRAGRHHFAVLDALVGALRNTDHRRRLALAHFFMVPPGVQYVGDSHGSYGSMILIRTQLFS